MNYENVTFSFSWFAPKKHPRWDGSGMTYLEILNWYSRYLPSTIRSVLEIFKGAKIIIYHNEIIYNSFYGTVLNELNKQGIIKLIPVFGRNGVGEAMLWRMKAIWDADTEYVFVRDVDYMATPRERAMIDNFISDGTIIHAISDAPAHSILMMGGTIGFRINPFKEMCEYKNWESLVDGGEKLNEMESDQTLINERIKEIFLNHSSSHRIGWKPEKPIGIERTELRKYKFDDISHNTLVRSNELCKIVGSCDFSIYEAVKLYDNEKISAIEERLNYFLKNGDVDNTTDRGVRFKKTGSTLLTLPHNTTARKKVLFSITDNDCYSFFAPLVSCLWNEHIGFTPIVFIVGTFEEWVNDRRKKLIIDKTIEVGGEVHFIPKIEGIQDSTVAQVARVYPFLVDYHDEQYVLTADADMLPMSKTWFHNVDGSSLHLFYADAYNYTKFPICYIGARIGTWKKINNDKPFEEELVNGLGTGKANMEAWCYDEEMFGKKAHQYIDDGGTYQYIVRGNDGHWATGRVDRGGWVFDKSRTDYIDAHSIRPAQSDENWSRVLELISFLLPERKEWFENYRNEYIK
jgi:hypothetical protein